MNWLIPILTIILSAIFYRLDGFGGLPDRFLPYKLFDKWPTIGINYTRYLIGPLIALQQWNWIYIPTYWLAVSIPYGENSITNRIFGPLKWFVIGFTFGLASLNLAVALWLGVISLCSKFIDIDHALWEFFIMGGLGTICYLWR